MARTLGTVGPGGQTEVNELPVDLLHATLGDGSEADAVAHVVVRAPALRGSWWREEVLFVMNAQFHGRWEPVPRVHPNDGRADVLRVAASLGVRQRLLAARRARHGAHLPHPALAVSRIVSAEWTFPRPMVVVVDGCVIGSTRQLTVAVRPDGGVVYV
jgi:hypothetical protein